MYQEQWETQTAPEEASPVLRRTTWIWITNKQSTAQRRVRELQTVHVDLHRETGVGTYEDEASGQEVRMLFGSDEQGFS